MLSKREFDALIRLADEKRPLSQRQIAQMLSCSVGTANKLLKDLAECGYYDTAGITPKGVGALEPYRVKRAVFIAAGFGARLVPITLNTPKPLIHVHGTRIIDTMLDAVVKAEIPEIVIVRGYRSEQFDQLLYKYPQIKFVENPIYNESNNISSAMCVRYLLKNAYVLDADLILNNAELIRKYEYSTNLLGIPVERTDDWCVTADKNGFATGVSMGGTNGFKEVGISYWTEEDGAKLAEDLSEVYQAPGGKERFWEEAPLRYKKDHYQISIRECSEKDVIEIDTFSELKKIDQTYKM